MFRPMVLSYITEALGKKCPGNKGNCREKKIQIDLLIVISLVLAIFTKLPHAEV